METIKKHLLSIVSAAVVLLALVVAWFISFAPAKANLETSERAYNEIKRLNSESFSLPLLDSRYPPPQVPGLFPSTETLNVALKIVKDYQKSAKEFVNDAIKVNRKDRSLLVDKVLPNGRGAPMMQFKTDYAEAFVRLAEELNAAPPPSDEDIVKAIAARTGATGDLAVDPTLRQNLDAETLRQINEKWANTYTMYLTPASASGGGNTGLGGGAGSFDIYDAIPKPTDGRPPELSAVWAATLSYWIQEDLVQAIRKTNGLPKLEKIENGATTRPSIPVTKAVVKRLVRIEIPKQYITRKGAVSIADGGGDRTAMATATGTTELPISAPPGFKDYTVGPTGRVCTTLYDVMHFTLVVDVDANNYAALLAHLEDNHFIGIRSVDLRAIDRQAWQDAGYFYGPDPAVQLTIQGEAIFFRDWTLDWMPASVKTSLGIKETAKK